MTTTPISPYVVETAGLTKRFGERTVVRDVELRVPRGVAFGYLGPNGAGKTTLIRMLLGGAHPRSPSCARCSASPAATAPSSRRSRGSRGSTRSSSASAPRASTSRSPSRARRRARSRRDPDGRADAAPGRRRGDAIRVVAAGNSLFGPTATRRLLDRFGSPPGEGRSLDELTDREREILALLAKGLSNAELAERLYLSETTVKTHVSAVLRKLGVRDRVQAVTLPTTRGSSAPAAERRPRRPGRPSA